MTRTLLALLVLSTLATPLAAAQAEGSDADQIDCGNVFVDGVIPVAVCLAFAGVATGEAVACAGWRLLWGQTAPCPT